LFAKEKFEEPKSNKEANLKDENFGNEQQFIPYIPTASFIFLSKVTIYYSQMERRGRM